MTSNRRGGPIPSHVGPLATLALVLSTSLGGCLDPTVGWMMMILAAPAQADASGRDAMASTATAATAPGVFDGYPTFAELQDRARSLAATNPTRAKVTTLARTTAGNEVQLLTLAAPGGTPPQRRPALLLVAGLDAGHRCGPAVAMNVAERLVQSATASATAPASTLLSDHTLYVLPLVSVDRLAALTAAVSPTVPATTDDRRNLRVVDDDRDDASDEDPPEDLDGDGRITQMRVRGRQSTHGVDAGQPRLLKRADTLKADVSEFEIFAEGIDNDGDGRYNEDGIGGVNLAANFPHLYRANLPDSGPHQISEPETRALADFLLAHGNIVAVMVYGPHDNIVKPPAAGKPDPSGQSFRELHPDDAALYAELSKQFIELTGLKDARTADVDGAFHAWCYSQRGLAAFATTLSQPPDGPPANGPAASAPATSAPTATTAATQPATAPADSAAAKRDDANPEVTEARRWLQHSDSRGQTGYAEWRLFKHPTLGNVEIGGFVEGFRTNPPANALADIADKQSAFLLELARKLPRVRVERTTVTSPGAGVYAIEMWLVNDGYLPTATAMARKSGTASPIIIRPQLPAERMLGGGRMEKIDVLPGGGGRERRRWLVLGTAGERVTFKLFHRPIGEMDVSVTLNADGN